MTLSSKDIKIIREMVRRNPDPDYAEKVGDDDDFALREASKFKELRMAELEEDIRIINLEMNIYK